MQILDCMILDVQTLQYKPRALLASLFYLLIGKYYEQFTDDQIIKHFPKSSIYLLDDEYAYNDLFADFLRCSFGY